MRNQSFLLVIVFSFVLNSVFSQTTDVSNPVSSAVPFLLIAPDSRAGAMGDVGVATSPDVNSQHWNPAKYALAEKNSGIAISYTPWLRGVTNDMNLLYLAGYKKMDKQTIALSLLYFSIGEITFTNSIGDEIKTVKPNEFAVDFSYSRLLSDNFSMGVAARYINSDLTKGFSVENNNVQTKVGQSVAVDISMYYQKKMKVLQDKDIVSLGLNISNVGSKISYNSTVKEFIPANLRIGAALKTDIDKYNSFTIAVDANKLLVPTTPTYGKDASGNTIILEGKDPNVAPMTGVIQSFNDAPGGFSEELQEFYYSIGAEYWYAKQFAVRGGYFSENKNKGNRKYFTLGLGLNLNVFGLDFSYLIPTTSNNPLENTLRFTLSFNLDKDNKKKN